MRSIYIQYGDREHRGQTYRGRDAASIARRIYGRRAIIFPSRDPNAPHDGTIGYPTRDGGLSVLAVYRYDDEESTL